MTFTTINSIEDNDSMTRIDMHQLASIEGGSILPNPCDVPSDPTYAGIWPPRPDGCDDWWTRSGWY